MGKIMKWYSIPWNLVYPHRTHTSREFRQLLQWASEQDLRNMQQAGGHWSCVEIRLVSQAQLLGFWPRRHWCSWWLRGLLLLWWPGARHKHHQHHDDERGVHGNRDSDLGCLWLLMGIWRQWFHWIRHVRWQLRLQPLDGFGHEDVGWLRPPSFGVRCFQMTFAIISSAIISGSLVERMRFSAYCIMLALWSLLIYAPLCHWVWGPGGWIGEMGALDFAGGTVVHISSVCPPCCRWHPWTTQARGEGVGPCQRPFRDLGWLPTLVRLVGIQRRFCSVRHRRSGSPCSGHNFRGFRLIHADLVGPGARLEGQVYQCRRICWVLLQAGSPSSHSGFHRSWFLYSSSPYLHSFPMLSVLFLLPYR